MNALKEDMRECYTCGERYHYGEGKWSAVSENQEEWFCDKCLGIVMFCDECGCQLTKQETEENINLCHICKAEET